jgi:hypothetical protein
VPPLSHHLDLPQLTLPKELEPLQELLPSPELELLQELLPSPELELLQVPSLSQELELLQELFPSLELDLLEVPSLSQELEHLLLLEPHNLSPELEPELEPRPLPHPPLELHLTPPLPCAETEFKTHSNNARDPFAAPQSAISLREEPLADSDPLEPPKFASQNQDVTLLEFADLPKSDKTQRRGAGEPMAPKENAISPLEPAHNLNYIYHRKILKDEPLQSCKKNIIMINNIPYF